MEWDFNQINSLTDNLIGCRSVKDDLSSIIEGLPVHIRRKIKICNKIHTDVRDLLSICLEYDNGIDQLLNIIYSFEGPSVKIQTVFQSLVRILHPPERIPHTVLARLFALLLPINIPDETLNDSYRQAVQNELSTINENISLCEAIQELSDFETQNNTHPLLLFIENLMKSVDIKDKKLSEKIKKLSKELASELGIKSEQENHINALTDKKESADPLAPFLMVILDSNSPDPEKREYAIKAYFVKNESEIETWYADGKMIERKDLAEQIETILTIDETGRRRKEVPKTIEFFMPYKDISHDMDQWPLRKYCFVESRFGRDYHILVRCLDRLKVLSNPVITDNWKKRWGKIFQNGILCIGNNTLWLDQPRTYDEKSLCRELKLCSDISCLLMPFKPDALIKAMLQEGIPIAIWSRKSEYNLNFQAEINKGIQENRLFCIPAFIKKKRTESDDENSIGNHLTLFWDDPNRIPPESLYGSELDISLQPPG